MKLFDFKVLQLKEDELKAEYADEQKQIPKPENWWVERNLLTQWLLFVLIKVAPNSLNIPINFWKSNHSYTSKVKEKLLAQVCRALTNEQI